MHKDMPKAIDILQRLLTFEQSRTARGYVPSDITAYSWFFLDNVAEGTKVTQQDLDPELFYLDPRPDSDAFDQVAWPTHNPVFVSTVLVGEEETPDLTVVVPYKRKGNFMVLAASLNGNHELVESYCDYGSGQELNDLPDIYFPDGTVLYGEQLSPDEVTAYSIPLDAIRFGVVAANSGLMKECRRVTENPANKKRASRGKKPLFDWHTVEIKPRLQRQGIAGEKTGIKHRQHDVRGHWCIRKSTGVKFWRNAHKRGDPGLGVVFKDYRIKS